MEAAPRIPDQDTRATCFQELRKGLSRRATTMGRATKVRKRATARPSRATSGSWEGKDSRPSRKKRAICIRLVMPSKKWTRDCLFCKEALPRRMPVMYTLKKPLPPRRVGAA